MKLVRIVKEGEKVDDIISEGKQLTFANDREFALVKLADGRRAIVEGDQDSIEFQPDEVVRIIGNTHPYSCPATGVPSEADRQMLKQLGQSSSCILEHGLWFKFTAD